MAKRKNIFIRIVFHPKMMAVLGLAILILISFPLAKAISQRYKINREIKELQEEIENINKKNTNLKNAIEYLKSDQFVEEQARLNLGLRKQGEEVIVIQNNSEEIPENNISGKEKIIFNIPGLEKEIPPKKVSNLQRWWNYFFNR